VDGLAEAMPDRLLTEWLAFASLEPFGAGVEENRYKAELYHQYASTGVVTANLMNMWSGRHARKLRPAEFIPEALKPETQVGRVEDPAVLYQQFKKAFGLVSRQ
jgi:hypothetical protein